MTLQLVTDGWLQDWEDLSRRLMIDGDPTNTCTILEFLDANEDLEGDDIRALAFLEVGQTLRGGGGAAAEWSVTRLPDK